MVVIMSFAHMPIFDVILRFIREIGSSSGSTALSTQIAQYSISGVTLLLFLILMLYLVRVFNICVPTEFIPWSAPISQIVFLNLTIKVILVVCTVYDRAGK